MRKTQSPSVLFVALGLMMLGSFSARSASAELLFADNFNRGNSSNLNASTAGKSGSLGPLTWGSDSLQSQIDINSNALRINNNDSDGNDGAWAWVNHNFTRLAEFSVSVDISQSSAGDGRYAGFRIGQTLADISGETNTSTFGNAADVAVYYDNVGGTRGLRIFEGATDLGYFAFPSAAGAPDTVSANFTFANMEAGTPLYYEVFFNGNSVMSDSTVWSGANENYISLQSNSTNDTRFDNFQVNGTPVPEPASLALLGLGLIGLIGYTRALNEKQNFGSQA